MKKQYISPIVKVVELGAREDCMTIVSGQVEGGGGYDHPGDENLDVKEETFTISGDQGVWEKEWK